MAAPLMACSGMPRLSSRKAGGSIKSHACRSMAKFFISQPPPDSTDECCALRPAEPDLQMDPLLQLVSLQKASGCWELNYELAYVFGKTEDEVTNHRPAQVDGSVWATVLALIWLYSCRSGDQVEWQFVAMKAASWIRSQKLDGLSQCVCDGNVLLGCQVTEGMLGI